MFDHIIYSDLITGGVSLLTEEVEVLFLLILVQLVAMRLLDMAFSFFGLRDAS